MNIEKNQWYITKDANSPNYPVGILVEAAEQIVQGVWVCRSSKYGTYNLGENDLGDVAEITGKLMQSYDVVTQHEPNDLFEFGCKVAKLYNDKYKALKEHVYVNVCIAYPNYFFKKIQEQKPPSDVQITMSCFGLTSTDQAARFAEFVLAMFSSKSNNKHGVIYFDSSYYETTNFGVIPILYGKLHIESCVPKLLETIHNVSKKYAEFNSTINDAACNVKFNLDGDKDFVDIKSKMSDISKKIETLTAEQDVLYKIRDYYTDLFLLQKYKQIEDEFLNSSTEQFCFDQMASSNYKIDVSATKKILNPKGKIKAINIPTIESLRAKCKKTSNRYAVLKSCIELFEEDNKNDTRILRHGSMSISLSSNTIEYLMWENEVDDESYTPTDAQLLAWYLRTEERLRKHGISADSIPNWVMDIIEEQSEDSSWKKSPKQLVLRFTELFFPALLSKQQKSGKPAKIVASVTSKPTSAWLDAINAASAQTILSRKYQFTRYDGYTTTINSADLASLDVAQRMPHNPFDDEGIYRDTEPPPQGLEL